MHICFFTHEYPKEGFPHGGIGTFIKTISKAYVNKGYKVSVVGINNYTNQEEISIIEGVTVYRLKPRKIKGLTWMFNSKSINNCLKKIHKETPIDVLETPELGLAFLKKLSGIKYIIRLHGGHHFFSEAEKRKINWWKGFQEKTSFKKSDAFIAVSNYVKDHTAKYLSYNDKKIQIIRYPIDLEVFHPKPDISISENTILFAGTICEKKGIRQLILAMKKVLEFFPEVKLEIYGRDWFFRDGRSYIEFLKTEVIPTLGEGSKSIIFKGSVSINELAEKYATSKLCIFPSLMETQGLVAPEAMAMEKLVIFSNCGPGPETISHKETGLLCNPYDVEDISQNIIWGLNNVEKSQVIAKNARKFVLSNYNIETLVKENIEFYKSV
ncbi:glycosyltransferase family 4 protein [Pontimicrobium sp. SW4]|uniref:Glycosyltransferase family 4 protein n=1 Tax=Pontimicrobium sp. SW4 TaxID=3153519 RepID=A0AAU7BVL6_9FLAO